MLRMMIIINIYMPVIFKSHIFSLGFSQCFKLYQLPARHVFLSDSVHFTLMFKSYHFFFFLNLFLFSKVFYKSQNASSHQVTQVRIY